MKISIDSLLEKCDSRLLAELWLFYRDHFDTDESCISFLHSVFSKEPAKSDVWKYPFEERILKNEKKIMAPRRMVNMVSRLVSAARDMEKIRSGKDIFKIVYIVSCVESLQKLSGSEQWEKAKSGQKKDMVVNFFCRYMLEADQEIILSKFKRSLGDDMYENGLCHTYKPTPDAPHDSISIKEFAEIVNELRNCASHEGEYWGFAFHPDTVADSWLMINVTIALSGDKKRERHVYQTVLTYAEFEAIFVRTCIEFIKCYVSHCDCTI